VAAGVFLFSCLVTSRVFGREAADHPLKDMLAGPVQCSRILLAKSIVTSAWSAVLAMLALLAGLVRVPHRLPIQERLRY
jgi:ABC-type transport system involved in cytochrome c biogenesis permease component